MSTAETAGSKPQLDRWNWGAAFFSWIWALGHKLWLYALLGFVLNFIPIVPFVLFGLKGNDWAWASGNYSSVDDLRATERKWAIAALIVFLIAIALFVVLAAAS
ncbi:MAG TPA: hypothetical protein VM049_02125 [Gaiellaceae bacterium]|nr:hypothetical protein [Gaiellaceae bacterium]